MASQNFQELSSAATSMGSIIDVRVIASFDFVIPRDFINCAQDNKTPILSGFYSPFLRFFIAYNPETKDVIPVFKNLRRPCLENFAVLAPEGADRDTSFINFSSAGKELEGTDQYSDANNPTKVAGKLAHIRCMEQNCPKRYYPGEHVKVYESFETAKPLRLFLTPSQSEYLSWVIYAAIHLSKQYKRHALCKFPPYDEYGVDKTLGYLIDLDQTVSYYPSEGTDAPNYSILLPTVFEGKENSIVGPDRIYMQGAGNGMMKTVKEKPEPGSDIQVDENGNKVNQEHKHTVLDFKHYVLDNGEEDLHIENKSSCSSCIDINYDEGCANGIGGGQDEMGERCHDKINHVRRKCYHNDEGNWGPSPPSYLKIYTKEYLSCWSVGETIYIKGEHKDPAGKVSEYRTTSAKIDFKGTDRWARNWIKVQRYAAQQYLNLKRPLKLIHACSQVYDAVERTICFCDCNGHSVKMTVLVTEDLSTYEFCQGPGTSLGVCCINGLCSEISRQACEAANGIWIDDKDCSDATPPCSEVLGVCCVGNTCSITTQLSCENAHGLWKPATPENPASCTDPANPCAGKLIVKITNSNGDPLPCGQADVDIASEDEGALWAGNNPGNYYGPHPQENGNAAESAGSLAVVVFGGNDPISDKVFFGSLGPWAIKQKTISLHPGKVWSDVTHAVCYSSWTCPGALGAIRHRQHDIATGGSNFGSGTHQLEFYLYLHL